jgi:hypothetical protein
LEIDMVNRTPRLAKTIKGHFHQRRLDLATEKNELIKDIVKFGGSDELDALHQEVAGFGEPLDEVLPSLSLPRLRRIHARVVLGTMDIPWVEEF